MEPIFIVVEDGVNHNDDREKAFLLVDVVGKAGADAVKCQTFKESNLVTKNVQKSTY